MSRLSEAIAAERASRGELLKRREEAHRDREALLATLRQWGLSEGDKEELKSYFRANGATYTDQEIDELFEQARLIGPGKGKR